MPTIWVSNGVVQWLITLGGIILVDIALSGDNALVIGAAASRLPPERRTIALLWGGVAAAILRIALTGVATELLRIPLLQTAGAAIILFIAVRMLFPEKETGERARDASDRLLAAILSIFVADFTMSLDNILAIGALARGNLPLLIIGLVISIALLLLASALVAQLISRFWWLMDLAALILAYLAAQLVTQDPIVARFFGLSGVRAIAVMVALVALVGVVALWVRFKQLRARRQAAQASAETQAEDAVTSAASATSDYDGLDGHDGYDGHSGQPAAHSAGAPEEP